MQITNSQTCPQNFLLLRVARLISKHCSSGRVVLQVIRFARRIIYNLGDALTYEFGLYAISLGARESASRIVQGRIDPTCQLFSVGADWLSSLEPLSADIRGHERIRFAQSRANAVCHKSPMRDREDVNMRSV